MYSVIIVEDELLVSIGLQNLVHWADLDMTIVGCAQNGKQGLELYREKKPDLILTDLKMPGMDGIEMIREIRKNDTETKIIVLTSYEEYELIREAFKLKVSDYILKLKMLPEDMETVIGKVRQELQEEQKHQQTKEAVPVPVTVSLVEKCKDYILGNCETLPDDVKDYWELDKKQLQVLELKLISLEKESLSKTRNVKEIQKMTIDLIREILEEKNSGIIMEEKEACYVLVLLYDTESGEEEMENFLKNLLNRIQSLLKIYMNIGGVFGASEIRKEPKVLGKLYEHAVIARKKADFLNLEYESYGEEKGFSSVNAETENAILYIREHYTSSTLSLSEVAHLVGMNKDYFSSLFKKDTGYGFVDYVNNMRIQKAKELLSTTNKKVYEVGMEVGFQDESYFSRVFKKSVGIRPKEYKNREI